MKNLASYLKKFTLLTPKEKTVREKFVEILNEESLPESLVSINYRNGTVYVKGNGVVKNEILLRQSKILESLNIKLERYNIKVTKVVSGL